jgi:hypothetical protein
MRFQSNAIEAAVMAAIFINDRLETDVFGMVILPYQLESIREIDSEINPL